MLLLGSCIIALLSGLPSVTAISTRSSSSSRRVSLLHRRRSLEGRDPSLPGFLPEYGNPQDGSFSPADYGAILREQTSKPLDHECMRHVECGKNGDHSEFCGFPPKKWWSQKHLTGEFIYTTACLPCRMCVPIDTPGHPMSPYNGLCPPCEAEAHLLGKYAPTGDEE